MLEYSNATMLQCSNAPTPQRPDDPTPNKIKYEQIQLYRMVWPMIFPSFSRIAPPSPDAPDPAFFSKTFQNLRLSSAAAVAIVWPSGLRQECKTLLSWAGISIFLTRVG